jgi:CO/xanthine dehydrogenase Mo-binding subunit
VAEQKLVGQNYTTPDLLAKVTGKAKYAEDFRADGMLFVKLLLSPIPHGRGAVDTSAAEAIPACAASCARANCRPRPTP